MGELSRFTITRKCFILMTITNTPKPSSGTQTDSARVVDYETFDTLTTTFDTETRTFDQMGTVLTNTSRPSSAGLTNTSRP